MAIRIKNWSKFQHFKDRRPPWVKLYRDLLDDKEWHKLEAKAAKLLVSLWLIASEFDGELPDTETLAFRLRLSEKDVLDSISKLSHWLEQDDIAAISSEYQAAPVADVSDHQETETETETETEKRQKGAGFAEFYAAYPKKVAKRAAEKAFAKVKAPVAELIAAIEQQKASEQWRKDGGQFIPYPATWLNEERWLDVIQPVSLTTPTNPAAIFKPEPQLTEAQLAANRERMQREMAKLSFAKGAH